MTTEGAKKWRQRAILAATFVGLAIGYFVLMYCVGTALHYLKGAPINDDAGRCGPHHHWKYVQVDNDLDTECQDDEDDWP
jgi:hypothetical protein